MSGPELMRDVPHSTGNTFIVFSNGENPDVRLAPSFSTVTGIAEVSGGLDNDVLSISWNGGWQVRCKKHSVWGRYSFSAAVTSRGSNTRAADTQIFELMVFVSARDNTFGFLYLPFRVGDKINIPLEQKPVNPILSYGKRGQLKSPDKQQYSSGLHLSLQDDGTGLEIPRITGTAKRPGIYVAAIHSVTDDSQDGFSGGTDMIDPVVVVIRDKHYEDNQLMVIADNPLQNNPNALRLVYADDELFNSKGGNFCIAMSGGNGEWFGRHEENVQTSIIVNEYRVVQKIDDWTLLWREYTQSLLGDDEPPPEWKAIAAAPAIDNSNIPPSAGWSNGAVISGDTRYFIPGYGLFDFKGVDDLGEFFQQQTTHTRQYDGWRTAAEYTNASGYMLRQKYVDDRLRWFLSNGTEVEPIPVSGVAFPYAPAVTEMYGSHAVRDLTIRGVSAQAPRRDIVMEAGGIVGSFFVEPDVRRQIVPYNGTKGDVKRMFAGVSVSTEKESFTERREKKENGYIEGEGEYNSVDGVFEVSHGIRLQIDFVGKELPYSRRSGDVQDWLMCTADTDAQVDHTFDANVASTVVRMTLSSGAPEGLTSTIKAKMSNEYVRTTTVEEPTTVTFYIVGGPDAESDKQHQLWALLRWEGGGASCNYRDVLEYTSENVYTDGSVENDTWTESYSGSVSYSPKELTLIPSRIAVGEELDIATAETVKERSVFTASVVREAYTWEYSEDEGFVVAEVVVTQRYTLRIELTRTYSIQGGVEITNEARAIYTRRETPPGTYADGVFPEPIITSGELENNDVLIMISAAKADVESCGSGAAGEGQISDGEWQLTGSRERLKLEHLKEERQNK